MELIILENDRERSQVGVRGAVLYDAFVIKLAAVRRTFQPIAKNL